MEISDEKFNKALDDIGTKSYRAGYERGFEDGLDAALKFLNKGITDHRMAKEEKRILELWENKIWVH